MYGFLITRGIPVQETALENPQMIVCGDIRFYYNPLPKFEKDHLFYEDNEKVVLLDGIILNNHELMDTRGCQEWRDTVDQLIVEDSTTFQKHLRGSFCGAVFYKNSGELILFTNQSGEKTVYYTQQNELFIAASHNNILTQVLQRNQIPVLPDIQSCRELLTLGSILHNKTPFKQVYRLTAGKCLKVTDSCEEYRYHMFHNVPELDLTLEECVEELDRRFRKAVDRIFAKSLEYGYQGECDLSGGLDSRMATWVAHDLGYKHITNLCYCQSGKLDHLISKKISKDLKNEYIFVPLDGGEYIMDIDEVVDKFGGQVSFNICTGANRGMKELVGKNIGICTTGLLGELPKGDWIVGKTHTPPQYVDCRYSKIIPFDFPEKYLSDYENREQLNFYEHGLPLMFSSLLVRQQESETVSPYLDVDYLEFTFKIKPEWRSSKKVMLSWIVTKYPKASKYVWHARQIPVYHIYYGKPYFPQLLKKISASVFFRINKLLRFVHLKKQFILSTEMHPMDTWYYTNSHLRNFMTRYYQENIGKISDPQLKEDVSRTFLEGNANDKVQALNVLAVYKRYF